MTQNIESLPQLCPTWASTGDIFKPSDEEIAQGWPKTETPPSRQRFNWILNYLSHLDHYLLQRGIPEWIKDQTYPRGAKVVGGDGLSYSALEENAGVDPTHSSKWERWGFSRKDIIELIRTAGGLGVPTGTILYFPSSRIPQGFLSAAGQLLERAHYPTLWHYAQASENICSDQEWLKNKMLGSFSLGDGDKTFRIPDLRGVFIRSFDGRTRQEGGIDEEGRSFGSLENEGTKVSFIHNPFSGGFEWRNCSLEKSVVLEQGKGVPATLPDDSSEKDRTRLQATTEIGPVNETRPVNINLLACIKN